MPDNLFASVNDIFNHIDNDGLLVGNNAEWAKEAVVKFLQAETVSGGGYCGTCHIINHGFDTKEEALEVITAGTIWLYGE